MKRNRLLVGFLFFSYLLVSCDSTRVYDDSTPIKNSEWANSNIVSHAVTISDTTKAYNLYLNIRNTKDYKYSNLYVFLETTFPSGKNRKDTIECPLANKKGKWYGKSAGNLVENRILFRRNSLFPDTGKYIFKIEQAMREEVLHGISDVGIRIEFAK